MIEWFGPCLTKMVPAIEDTMQAAQIAALDLGALDGTQELNWRAIATAIAERRSTRACSMGLPGADMARGADGRNDGDLTARPRGEVPRGGRRVWNSLVQKRAPL